MSWRWRDNTVVIGPSPLVRYGFNSVTLLRRMQPGERVELVGRVIKGPMSKRLNSIALRAWLWLVVRRR